MNTFRDQYLLRVGYADQNGRPYRSVARVLIDRGELPAERASMQAIRDWGRRHPAELPAILDENPSYVFFREVPPPAAGTPEAAIDGPIGTLGVPLAAGRALAVDPRAVPLVDEIVALPLDLIAAERGYTKISRNVMGF